jgi:hypothetical protein
MGVHNILIVWDFDGVKFVVSHSINTDCHQENKKFYHKKTAGLEQAF